MPSSARTVPPWATIAVLALCGMIVSLQQTLVIPLLPEFPELLGVSVDDSSWLVTATLLSSAIFTPIVSRMADMYGKRKMLLLALAVMVLGSVIAAVGGTFAAVIVGRAMQGFASSLIPVGISVLRDELPREKIGSAVALMSATLGIGGALGMPLSGVLYNALGWQSLFWFTASAGVVFIVGLLLLVKESTLTTPGRFDVVGAVILSAIVTSILLAVSKGASWGWGSPLVLGLFALAIALLTVWIPLELRVNQPMVDLRTSVKRAVLLTNLASFFACFAMFVNMLITTQQLHLPVGTGHGFGLTVLGAGLAMVPSGLVMVALAPVAGWMLNRLGGRFTLIFGTAIMGATYVGRVFFDDSVAQVIVAATLVNVGVAFAFAAMPTLIMGAVPITETASANGVNALVRSLGTSVASATTGLLLSAVVFQYDGGTVPSVDALHIAFWLAAASSAVGIGIALFLPRPDSRDAASSAAGTGAIGVVKAAGAGARETMVHGRVRFRGHAAPTGFAIVTFVREDGTPADWARTEHDGRFSAVLPGPGRYVVVVNAAGWSPRAVVIDFSGTSEQDLELTEKLSLSGTVTRDGLPVSAALVTMSAGIGDFMSSTHTGGDGTYQLPMPAVGTYVLTAVDPAVGSAWSLKVNLSAKSENIDIGLPR
ncbi:MFS transporter [Arthrobacter sp. KK5.5]|uniref:MFS transporter n=1 Tax=Arthrobacter sp. KK5.5 TaxID=3373084 RepID=UPI003EE78331